MTLDPYEINKQIKDYFTDANGIYGGPNYIKVYDNLSIDIEGELSLDDLKNIIRITEMDKED